jgi:hypothetical protein
MGSDSPRTLQPTDQRTVSCGKPPVNQASNCPGSPNLCVQACSADDRLVAVSRPDASVVVVDPISQRVRQMISNRKEARSPSLGAP